MDTIPDDTAASQAAWYVVRSKPRREVFAQGQLIRRGVETFLPRIAERVRSQLLESLNLQLGLARETYQRNRERYIKGQTDYIRVLESLQSLQALERNVVTAERTLIGHRIDLYRSIAGSFEIPESEMYSTSIIEDK